MTGNYTHPGDDFTDDSEEVLLARAIFGEARGESDEGKRAVGFSIKNRVKDKKRGYHDVILQPSQYSAFNKGDANYEKIKDPEKYDKDAWEKCLEAAKKVIECNENLNPINGATHYHDTSIDPPPWAAQGERLKQIGRLIFYVGVPYSVPKLPMPIPVGVGGLLEQLKALSEKLDVLEKMKKSKEGLTGAAKDAIEKSIEALAKEIQRETEQLGKQSATTKPAGDEKQGGIVKPKNTTHHIEKGETLSGISQKEYGTTKYTKQIQDANDIQDPTKIRPCMNLKMPEITESEK